MNIAAIIIGIDGWHEYTLPLIDSIREHEPDCAIVTIDNESDKPYPFYAPESPVIVRVDSRLCYSAAINLGKRVALDFFDWYIVLSNDVLCTGPFAHMLEAYGDGDLVGPLLKHVHGFDYLEGWCVAIPAKAWEPWDERFLGSDYEDVAYSTSARQRGFGLIEDRGLPFKHLDQRQRFHVVENFAGKNAHNRDLFLREYAAVTA